MAIAYSGGPYQNVVFSQSLGTKQELINEVETVLLAAGWTTVSGHGTTSLLMQSAKTPQNLQMKLKVQDNGGVCITFSISNVSGSAVGGNSTTAGGQLLPAAGKAWRMIADPYQAFFYNNAIVSPCAARDYVAFGVPWLPPNLVGDLTEAIWLNGNAANDTDTAGNTRTFRDALTCIPTNNTGSDMGWQSTIVNGNLAEGSNSGSCLGILGLGFCGNLNFSQSAAGFQFYNGDNFVLDPWLFWGPTGTNSAGR